MTDRPSDASRYAVVRPAIPAPTTHISAVRFSLRAGRTGIFTGAHTAVVGSEVFMLFSSAGIVVRPLDVMKLAVVLKPWLLSSPVRRPRDNLVWLHPGRRQFLPSLARRLYRRLLSCPAIAAARDQLSQ